MHKILGRVKHGNQCTKYHNASQIRKWCVPNSQNVNIPTRLTPAAHNASVSVLSSLDWGFLHDPSPTSRCCLVWSFCPGTSLEREYIALLCVWLVHSVMNHCGMSSHPASDSSRIASTVNPTKQMALMNQTQQLGPATIAITVNQVPLLAITV